MKSIIFIIPYFGKWPVWFEAHLVSIKANDTIDWLFFTDCPIPENHPLNCKFVKSSMEEMEELFSKNIGFPIPIKKPYKLCDLKPSYGLVFANYIQNYDFWGFTDIDIVWGNIRNKDFNHLLEEYDLISSRKELISGHFTIIRNNNKHNTLYQKDDLYRKSFADEKMMRFCEGTFSQIVKKASYNNDIQVYWPKILCNQENGRDSHQEYHLDKWLWKDGKMLGIEDGKPINEVMYLHFINWKRTMKYNEITYIDHPSQFYISYNGMHYIRHSGFSKTFNVFKNYFNGYRIKESRRIKRKKLNKMIKRFKNRAIKVKLMIAKK